MSISEIRKSYTVAELEKDKLQADPIKQFRLWFDEALAAGLLEPNAMTLATVDKQGRPSARMVLLKDIDERGFVFFSNYQSRKAQDMADNPQVALVFYWYELERQVRIEGVASKIPAAESEAYFKSRPRESQLGAWVSQQSRVIASRELLSERYVALEKKYPEAVPRPEFWGGYVVAPQVLEFWQGRLGRLHDRFCYRRLAKTWIIERLSP